MDFPYISISRRVVCLRFGGAELLPEAPWVKAEMNKSQMTMTLLNEGDRQPGGQMKGTLKSKVKKTNVETDSKKLADI